MNQQLPNLYENSGYQFERRERKTLLLDIVNDTSAKGGSSTSLSGNDQLFAVELHEPLRIDKLSDIYLDSFTTFNAKNNRTSPNIAFVLGIDQFNINSNSTKDSKLFNKIIIPNDATSNSEARVHKGKKMNYICSINPETLTTISGSITDLAGSESFASNGRFIAEFVIIARD